VDPNTGTIYSDIFGSSLVAIDPDGSEKWRYLIVPSSDVGSTPVVDSDGVIYFGTDIAQELIALNPNGSEKWRFATIGAVDNVPALNQDESVVYFVATDPDTANNDAMLYAVDTSNGNMLWQFPLAAENNEITSSPTVDTRGTDDPNDDVIYVGDDDNYLYAFKPAARLADPNPVPPLGTFPGAGEWRFNTGGEIESSAAVDPDDRTIYIGSDEGSLWAVNPNGTEKWSYYTGAEVESSPLVDLDGTIYVGSTNGRFFALNPDGSLKWAYPIPPLGPVGSIPGSPALGLSGFIHIGSNDSNFYTISQFANPRNFKLKFPNNKNALLTSDDLDSTVSVSSNTNWLNGSGIRGPWAVRLQVDRSLVGVMNPLGELEYDYTLRLWMRQCNNDTTCDNILGTFFEDTRIEYDYTAIVDLPMTQQFKLSQTEHDAFERFFLGFTGAAGAEALDVTISDFQSSFIRPGDPMVDCDKNNWPLEDSPPLPDCVPQL
jgi:outer membrane protein assembly factor BamB